MCVIEREREKKRKETERERVWETKFVGLQLSKIQICDINICNNFCLLFYCYEYVDYKSHCIYCKH